MNKYPFCVCFTKHNIHNLFKKFLYIDNTLLILGTKEQHCCGILVLNLHAHVLIYITYKSQKNAQTIFPKKETRQKNFFPIWLFEQKNNGYPAFKPKYPFIY